MLMFSPDLLELACMLIRVAEHSGNVSFFVVSGLFVCFFPGQFRPLKEFII